MTVTPKVLIASKQAENSQTTQYTATNVKALIDKFTVSNTTAGAETLSINLVASGGTASNSNKIISALSVPAGDTIIVGELSAHVLEAGGFISTIASASSALTIRCSGREVS